MFNLFTVLSLILPVRGTLKLHRGNPLALQTIQHPMITMLSWRSMPDKETLQLDRYFINKLKFVNAKTRQNNHHSTIVTTLFFPCKSKEFDLNLKFPK